METRRKSISRSVAPLAAFALIVFLAGGCATLHAYRQRNDPLTPSERLNLGVTYEQEGKLDLALREYRRAEHTAMKSTSLTYQGNIHVARKEFRDAERCYRAALRATPDNLAALNNLACVLVSENRSLAEAETLILHALSLHPLPREPYEDTLRLVREQKTENGRKDESRITEGEQTDR